MRPEIAGPPEIAVRFSVFRRIDPRLHSLALVRAVCEAQILCCELRILSLIATK